MTTMTVPVHTTLAGEEELENGWYGFDLELRTPPPTYSNGSSSSGGNIHGLNGSNTHNMSRKRGWDEVATPVPEFADPTAWEDTFDLMGSSDMSSFSGTGFVTPAFTQTEDGSITLDGSDFVEEIPRTKMQTGCIPCLYVARYAQGCMG